MQSNSHRPPGDQAALQRTGSSSNTTASLRPRNRRFITGLEEFSSEESAPPALLPSAASPFGSPFQSRAASPIPSKHPSRSSSSRPVHHDGSPQSKRLDANSANYGNELATSLSSMWGKSWTSLQGLASNVLGSDASTELLKDKPAQRQRRPLEYTHSATQKQWGPPRAADSKLGEGTQEERQAKLRAKKREELLMSRGVAQSDASFKRRTSDDFDSTSAPPGEDGDHDALVYVYPVQRTDTLPGIAIKFSCSIDVIKKVNRLYSNTGVQIKKHLFIPVDACAVKGRRLAASDEDTTSLLDTAISGDGPVTANGSVNGRDRPSTSSGYGAAQILSPKLNIHSAPSSPPVKALERKNWQHDSWIQLDGQTSKIEMARIPRRELAPFPRARRKSVSYSDLDTPNASFDLARPSIATSESSSGVVTEHRKRRSSSANQWAQQMIGPGGVGSLSGKGASAPGPADDKLNKAMRKHLPNLAPKMGPGDAEGANYGGNTMTLEQVGGAIEGWVRKLAKSATARVGQPASGASGRLYDGVNLGTGDLIELSNAFELGDDEDGEDEGADRGRVRQGDATTSSREAASLVQRRKGD